MIDPPRKRQRLSANVARHWLFDREWRAMPDDARTLWVSVLQFCIGETDGYLRCSELDLLLPADAARRQAALEWLLANKGQYRLVPHTRDGGGWRVPDWTNHNTQAAVIRDRRAKDRDKKAQKRADHPDVPLGTSPGDVKAKGKSMQLGGSETQERDDWMTEAHRTYRLRRDADLETSDSDGPS
jgi:hypothetical protein